MMDIIRYKLPDFLSAKDTMKLSLTNKANFENMKGRVDEKRRWEKICKMFPENIIDIVGKERFLKGKYVEWQERWLGGTQYIDRIYPEDLEENLSLWDRFLRAILYLYQDSKTKLQSINRRIDFSQIYCVNHLQTLFRLDHRRHKRQFR